jgi:AraC-like DNA-binding protein
LLNYKHEKKIVEKRICLICNQEFEASGSNWGQKFCSQKCGKKATAQKESMDIQHVLKKRIRCRVNEFINDKKIKVSGCIRFLGCSVDELKQRFETMFYTNPETGETMTWENRGFYGWHIDHIKPLASFNLADPEQIALACHYTNLQPLWAEDNLKKGDKYEQ